MDSERIYQDIRFPEGHATRPYTFINMVATIDGKTLSGTRDESVLDLGSKLDHRLMRRIEETADAVMIGAQTLRSSPRTWNPRAPKRIVVTRSGNLPDKAAFYEGEAYAAIPGGRLVPLPAFPLGPHEGTVDLGLLFSQLRAMEVRRVLVLGGSELNGALLQEDLIDELFLTIAPKVKLGSDIPTYAGGSALPREHLLRFGLVEHHIAESEVFLRYRRERDT
jgi:riboflavin biosynthesis pyrimidine reductase